MKKYETLKTNIVVIDTKNIDTDQIIGSDHLKITDKKGLGKHLFSDWRYLSNGEPDPEFALNRKTNKTCKVLVAGDNFGCGSSREHAPWALLDFGIEVVISSSIADIFSNNSIKNGLLPIQVSNEQHQFLLSNNDKPIEIDLANQEIICENQSFHFEVEPFARYCLLNGFEQLDFLINHLPEIEAFEKHKNEQTNNEKCA